MRLKLSRWSGRSRTIVIVLLCIVVFYAVRATFYNKQAEYEPFDAASLISNIATDGVPYYMMAMQREAAAGIQQPTEPILVDIDAARYLTASPEANTAIVPDGKLGRDVLHWQSGEGSVEWDVEIPQDGLYEIQLEYMPLPGTSASVVRGLQIDGSYPFRESEKIELERRWKDSKYPYDRNKLGNEVRAPQEEVVGWSAKAVADYAASSLPLQYRLTKGHHTLRMIGAREPLALASIRLVAAAAVPEYRDYVAENEAGYGAENAAVLATEQPEQTQSGWFQVFEAEHFIQKSQIGIQKYAVMEARVSPDAQGRVVYNTLGADRWQQPGQWLDWQLEVPADGWYELDVKYRQSYKGSSNVYRTIMLDGTVPFKEMLHYKFAYDNTFDMHTLQDDSGTPYKFYMTKGSHTLRMIADGSPDMPALLALQQTLAELRQFDAPLRAVIGDYNQFKGPNIDANRTWDIKKYVPDIEQKLAGFIDQLQNIMAYINGLNGAETNLASTIRPAVLTLQSIAEDVDDLPNRLTQLTAIQTQIGTWIGTADYQPLLLDYFVVRDPDTVSPLQTPGQLEKLAYSTKNFVRTFFLNYTAEKSDDEQSIDVWVQRGRDYVDLLQEHIDQDFTPRTGIKVNLNLMPNPNALVLGNAAGNQPDVALGVGMEMPVDFAMRGATADLKQFPGFTETVSQFHPGLMRSYTYDGEVYGLPETQNFLLFFYRSDIFDRLALTPPDTWEDIYRMLPTLQENGMTFYIPPKDYVPFYYQHGIDFYTENGMNTRLDEEAALQPFKQWTDLFKKYYIPLEVPAFYNHFRYGTIPAGIADFTTYVQLTAAATNIAGQWKVAPVPGTKQPDGTVARWTQQGATSMMIMEKSRKKAQAWSFLQWWSDKETQLHYAQEIESFFGIEYRWNSANMLTLAQSPWPDGDLQAIKEQARWIKNVPLVPGYYSLGREMDFAWNHVLVGGIPAKEALEQAAVSLQRELRRKQQQFGYEPSSSDLHIPQIDQPYDWRESE
ncbi:extracellular solute-binding protein [Paenibacillus eucommiae]|uniref:ABC-type glycerol-3-phosphate transport system substrate-binding protein n=1 Tax=Paenibacillus eucommiae TaxID=1355755 RepID=A0ABS4J485_9BACL|nr:extracellular solute-binding protein [Paenibacillus eucommiae]MBP1993614.1 ABC-type glycerol-3-phosphate transport system substrate-binding protein [Paenibacillus eucommiae]